MNMDKLVDVFDYDGLSIRRAKNDDIKKLVGIINDAFSYQDKVIGAPRTSVEHLSQRMKEADFFVIENNQEIVACFCVEAYGKALFSGMLAVIPSYRGKGLIEEIIRAKTLVAKNAGYEALEHDRTSIAPWLKKYYEGYGFVETGEIEDWGPVQLIRMRKVL